mmetsp:Transcript_44732/g.112151  ORF Transcript_44732/g.112151 Transcript_44732/m.112151 type:complete len:426 (+) Transcript_44732:73-1350(+)
MVHEPRHISIGGGGSGTEGDGGKSGICARIFGGSRKRGGGSRGETLEEGKKPPNAEDAPPGFVRATCGHCGVLLQAPAGVPMVKCGACGGVCEVSVTYNEDTSRTHDGYLNPQCCLSRVTYCCPKKSFFYFAFLLTTYIIGAGFFFIAPITLPDFHTPLGLLLWCFSLYLSVTVAYNYYMGANADPGAPATLDEHGGSLSFAAGGVDMCSSCKAPKPPRTHHCSTCKRCVVGMDHHCVFLNNCVGDGNIAYFMRFLCWVTVSCAFVCACCTTACSSEMSRNDVYVKQVVHYAFYRGGKLGAYAYIPQFFAMHNIILFISAFAESCGGGTIALLITSGLTCLCVFSLLLFHVLLAWYGKTQLQYSFNIDPGNSKKGFAGIRDVLGERFVVPGAGFLDRNWWWIAALGPLPVCRNGRGRTRPQGKSF